MVRSAFALIAAVEQSLRERAERWTIAARAAKVELFDWDLATDVVTLYLASGVRTTRFADFLDSLDAQGRLRLNEALASAKATRGRFSSDHLLRRDGGGREEWKNFIGKFQYAPDGTPLYPGLPPAPPPGAPRDPGPVLGLEPFTPANPAQNQPTPLPRPSAPPPAPPPVVGPPPMPSEAGPLLPAEAPAP